MYTPQDFIARRVQPFLLSSIVIEFCSLTQDNVCMCFPLCRWGENSLMTGPEPVSVLQLLLLQYSRRQMLHTYYQVPGTSLLLRNEDTTK